jgi:hypothetical protein
MDKGPIADRIPRINMILVRDDACVIGFWLTKLQNYQHFLGIKNGVYLLAA